MRGHSRPSRPSLSAGQAGWTTGAAWRGRGRCSDTQLEPNAALTQGSGDSDVVQSLVAEAGGDLVADSEVADRG